MRPDNRYKYRMWQQQQQSRAGAAVHRSWTGDGCETGSDELFVEYSSHWETGRNGTVQEEMRRLDRLPPPSDANDVISVPGGAFHHPRGAFDVGHARSCRSILFRESDTTHLPPLVRWLTRASLLQTDADCSVKGKGHCKEQANGHATCGEWR